MVNTVAGDRADKAMKDVAFYNIDGRTQMVASGPFATAYIAIPWPGTEGDRAVVEFSKGFQLIGGLEEDLEIEVKKNWAHCKSGAVTFKCPAKTEGIEDPVDVSQLSSSCHGLDGSQLYRALKAASIATAKLDHANLGLRGVHLKLTDGSLIIEACDGAEMVRSTIAVDALAEFDVIIPQQAIGFLTALCSEEDVDVMVRALPNEILFSFSGPNTVGTVLTVKLHTGQFPDIGQLIPESSEVEVGVVSDQLIKALRRADGFSASPFVDLTFTGNTILVGADGAYGDRFQEEVATVVNFEEPILVRAVAKNLVSCFQEMKSAVVNLHFDREPSRLKVTPQAEGFQFTYVTTLGRIE